MPVNPERTGESLEFFADSPGAPAGRPFPAAGPILRRRTATIDHNEIEMPTFPEWWRWDLTFTSHAELRMEQRGVTEVEVRAMLEHATGFEPSVVEGRFMIHARRPQSAWVVIVEPSRLALLLMPENPSTRRPP